MQNYEVFERKCKMTGQRYLRTASSSSWGLLVAPITNTRSSPPDCTYNTHTRSVSHLWSGIWIPVKLFHMKQSTHTYSIKLDEKLSFESSAGVMLALSPLAQQTVNLICIEITINDTLQKIHNSWSTNESDWQLLPMKMIDGCSSLATANKARTSFSPSPTWKHAQHEWIRVFYTLRKKCEKTI